MRTRSPRPREHHLRRSGPLDPDKHRPTREDLHRPLEGRKSAFRDTFATKALAESYRSKLLIAQREGTAFDVASGLPEPIARKLQSRSFLTHAQEFVDAKWPHSSPKHRISIAEALATITPALLTSDRGRPPRRSCAPPSTGGPSTRPAESPVRCRTTSPASWLGRTKCTEHQ